MVRASADHHSSGPWSLKDRADSVVSSSTRGRTVSTHILGIGIALVGVLFLAVGLIMGLEFPSYVHKQNKEKQCVVYSGHEKYTSWSQGSQWNRKVSAYYWTLVNAYDFLYKGDKPQFVQRGPYIYTQTDNKYDVNFDMTQVTYRLRRQYKFDPEATDLACSSCSEQDQLTILSPWYLQTIGRHGGEEALSWTYISVYTMTYLKAAGMLYTEDDDDDDPVFSQNVSILGSYSTEFPSVFSNQPLVNFSFGAWLYSSSGSYKSTIHTHRDGHDLTLSEVKSLYRILTNVTLLGGEALSTPNRTLQYKCRVWAQKLCTFTPSGLVASRRRRTPSGSQVNVGVAECGVIYIFHKCHSHISSEASGILQETFCPSTNRDACLNLTSLPEDLFMAYESAISDFLWHLSAVVLDSFLSSRDLSLVVSRNQSQLALGYDVLGDDVFQEIHMTGLLHSHWIGDADGAVPLWKVYTCLESRNMDNNMKVKEYNNSWSFIGGSAPESHKVSVTSFTDFVTSCPGLSTCQTCSSPGPSLTFFVADLLRAAPFWLNSSTSVGGVRVFRYQLDPGVFSSSSLLNTANSLQNMAGLAGYLSWASLPMGAPNQMDHATLDTTSTPAESYVLIEPVTGRVWERNIKLQWNVGIRNQSAHAQGRIIGVPDLPLPLIWTERTATITKSEVEAYKHLVTRLMSVSCGGMIGFSVVAIIIVIIGIVVCVYPSKPNRISPIIEDNSHVMSNGRHL